VNKIQEEEDQNNIPRTEKKVQGYEEEEARKEVEIRSLER
jgi:hypothetical protein